MKRLFENDDVILDKDENNEYRLSFFKDCLHILADFVTLSFCHMFPKQL